MTKHVRNSRSQPRRLHHRLHLRLHLHIHLVPYRTARTRSRKIITYKSAAMNSMLFTGSARTLRFLFVAPAIVHRCQHHPATRRRLSLIREPNKIFFPPSNLYNPSPPRLSCFDSRVFHLGTSSPNRFLGALNFRNRSLVIGEHSRFPDVMGRLIPHSSVCQ